MSTKSKRALITGKLVNAIGRNRDTDRSGSRAMKIDAELMKSLSGIDPAKVLFITGTNGKSSVKNLVCYTLRANGYKVVTNNEGADLITGVATALIKASSLSGSISADYYVFEIDANDLYQLSEQLPCSNLLVINLQKAQMHTAGDPDFIARKISRVIDKFGMKLILNGDDPRSCALADRSDNTVFFGVEKHSQAFRKNDTFVTMPCPKCHGKIRIDHYNNDGMGGFCCEKCGYTNNNGSPDTAEKEADYKVTEADFAGKRFRINGAEAVMPYDPPYMLYNYAAAAAACSEIADITPARFAQLLGTYKISAGRLESFEYKGKDINYMRLMPENPGALQDFINMIAEDKREKVVVVGLGTADDSGPYYINSFYAFDCDYSRLEKSNVRKYIFVTDTIAYDAANSFIYGGVNPSKVEVYPTSDEEEILQAISLSGCDNIYLTIGVKRFERMKEFAEKVK